jgi:hypothetical protein
MMHFTFLQLSGNYCKVSTEIGPNPFLRVEAQLRLLIFRIRTMAIEATIRKNRSNIAIEIDFAT